MIQKEEQYYPVVLFTYNRPEHLKRCVEALQHNPEFAGAPVIVYSDGPRGAEDRNGVNRVREILRLYAKSRAGRDNDQDGGKAVAGEDAGNVSWNNIFRESNYGIERNEIEGIGEVLDQYGAAIIVEDDIVAGPHFLSYMNAALRVYRDEKRAFSINGYTNLTERDIADLPECGFARQFYGWGWATWKDRWDLLIRDIDEKDLPLLRDRAFRKRYDMGYYNAEMLEMQIRHHHVTWDCRWYWTIVRYDGLVLQTSHLLSNNMGTDGSGIHFTNKRQKNVVRDLSYQPKGDFPSGVEESEAFTKKIVEVNRRISWRYKLGHNRLADAIGIWD